jgi:hypothetical protein
VQTRQIGERRAAMPGAKKAKEERNEGSKAKGERESWRYGVCRDARDKRGRPLVLPVFLLPLPVPPLSRPPQPAAPRAINGHAGRGIAEWAAAQGGSYGIRTSGGQAGTPA